MVLPVSGSITANDIQGEFGQTQGGAFRIQDYYRSGSICLLYTSPSPRDS